MCGPGGSGKTRLALELVHLVAREFADGICLVELAPAADSSLLAETIARALGGLDLADRQLADALADHFRARRALLILDNCEHLVDACGQLVSALLSECPQLRVLATSRERLGITGEAIWPVAPLSVVDPSHLGAPESELSAAVAASEAARLFVDRAQLVMPSFAATGTNLRPVARITQALDGLPLALELAAARIGALSAAQIADRLSDALGLLTQSSRTSPDRQKTMRATLDWSYRLQSAPERRLFECLSVFADGWTLDAAEAICSGRAIPRHAVLELLEGLVTKSVVSVQLDPDGEYRYRMLEPIRQYAAERLAARPADTRVYSRRHAEYFLELRWRASHVAGRGASSSIHLDRDNANVARGLRWCISNGSARVRPSARVILFDQLQRVLLFRNEEQVPSNPDQPEVRSYWFTPGGGLQPGEDFEGAALREMREETGITDIRLGPCVWVGQYAGFRFGEPVLADDRYFLGRTENTSVDPGGMHPDERSEWRAFRWWTLAELRQTTDAIRPAGYVGFLEPLLEGQIPCSPIRIYGDRVVQEAIAAASSTAPPDRPLTRREADVVMLLARGYTNRQIAEQLVIATSTVERHVANILIKLDLSSRTQIAAWAADAHALAVVPAASADAAPPDFHATDLRASG
jgi:predicted ATPase/DNA-binding CsgD family transcriptional regulator/ADP-ribose pyrophosphatase YjhB (NUDIX family)